MEEYIKCKNQLIFFAMTAEKMLKKKDCYDSVAVVWYYGAIHGELDKCKSICKSLGIEDDEFQFLSEMEDIRERFGRFAQKSYDHLKRFRDTVIDIRRAVSNITEIADHVCKCIADRCDGDVVLSDAVVAYDKEEVEYLVGFLNEFSENFDCYKADIIECVEKAQEVEAMLDKYAKDKGIKA